MAKYKSEDHESEKEDALVVRDGGRKGRRKGNGERDGKLGSKKMKGERKRRRKWEQLKGQISGGGAKRNRTEEEDKETKTAKVNWEILGKDCSVCLGSAKLLSGECGF